MKLGTEHFHLEHGTRNIMNVSFCLLLFCSDHEVLGTQSNFLQIIKSSWDIYLIVEIGLTFIELDVTSTYLFSIPIVLQRF